MIALTPFRAELYHNDLYDEDMKSASNPLYIGIYYRSVAGQWFDNTGSRVGNNYARLLEQQYKKQIQDTLNIKK